MAIALEHKDPAETVVVTFSYDGLGVGETILSSPAPAVVASVLQGTDSNPAAILLGGPQISGSSVLHQVRSGLAGVIYKLRCTITTSAGRVLVIAAKLPVETF